MAAAAGKSGALRRRAPGKLVRGSGAFEVEDLGGGRSRVIWSEWVQLPLGLLGETGWLAVRPVIALFLGVSLRRLARLVEAGDK